MRYRDTELTKVQPLWVLRVLRRRSVSVGGTWEPGTAADPGFIVSPGHLLLSGCPQQVVVEHIIRAQTVRGLSAAPQWPFQMDKGHLSWFAALKILVESTTTWVYYFDESKTWMMTDSILWKYFKLYPTVRLSLGVFCFVLLCSVLFCFVLFGFLTTKFGNRAGIGTSVMEPWENQRFVL